MKGPSTKLVNRKSQTLTVPVLFSAEKAYV